MEDRKDTLPQILLDYIDTLINSVGTKKVQFEVAEELRYHFMDAMGGSESDRNNKEFAKELIEDFGDAKMLGKLIKRGKKRCRPLWQKVLLRTLFTLCGLIVFMIIYGIWFFTGEPTFNVDYLARLNEMTKPVATAGQNAWPDYEKAISLYVKPEQVDKNNDSIAEIVGRTIGNEKYLPFGELPSEKQALVIEWIDRNQQAWEQYQIASDKDYSYREYTVGDDEGHPMLLAVLVPYLSEIKDLAKLGIWRSEKQTSENKPAQATQTCLSVIRSGLHWDNHKGTLIEQLVGQAIMKLGHIQLISIVARGELSSDDMAEIQNQLNDIFTGGFPQMSMKAEQLTIEDFVQHSFTKGGPGGGHILPKIYLQLSGNEEELAYIGAGLIHAGRDKTLALADKLYDQMEKVIKASPYEIHTGKIQSQSIETIMDSHGKWRYTLLWILLPAIDRVGEIRYNYKALHDATLTILAAKRRQLDKGELPESLEQLQIEGYLKQLPPDPYSEGILTYAKRNGDFLLYSIAGDFKDNGGNQTPDDPWARKEQGGDRVFWPIQQRD
jgi:hypothetical protein